MSRKKHRHTTRECSKDRHHKHHKKHKHRKISPMFVLNTKEYPRLKHFHLISFENPIETGWKTKIHHGYTQPTTFIVPTSGYYGLTFKIIIKADDNVLCSALMTCNKEVIYGSSSMIECKPNDCVHLSSTVSIMLKKGDGLCLLFWSNHVHHLSETIASIMFTRIQSIECGCD